MNLSSNNSVVGSDGPPSSVLKTFQKSTHYKQKHTDADTRRFEPKLNWKMSKCDNLNSHSLLSIINLLWSFKINFNWSDLVQEEGQNSCLEIFHLAAEATVLWLTVQVLDHKEQDQALLPKENFKSFLMKRPFLTEVSRVHIWSKACCRTFYKCMYQLVLHVWCVKCPRFPQP